MGTKVSGAGAGGGGASGSGDGADQSTLDGQERTPSEREVEEACEARADQAKVPEGQGKTVAERRDRLRETLDEKLNIKDEHVYGSFTRGTLVGPLSPDSDTDVMIVLDEDDHGHWASDRNGARNALQAIKRAIENDPKYRNTEVAIDRNVVAVKYHDSTIEIAPAFEKGDDYVIPDTYQGGRSWVRTNPRKYKQMFEATNEARGGKLEQLARLAKKYNEATGGNAGSYHTELIAHEYMRSRPKRDEPIDEHLDRYFERLPGNLSSGTYDPATRQRVDGGMSREDRQQAIADAKAARKKIRRAKRLKNAGNAEKAKELYREVWDGNLE